MLSSVCATASEGTPELSTSFFLSVSPAWTPLFFCDPSRGGFYLLFALQRSTFVFLVPPPPPPFVLPSLLSPSIFFQVVRCPIVLLLSDTTESPSLALHFFHKGHFNGDFTFSLLFGLLIPFQAIDRMISPPPRFSYRPPSLRRSDKTLWDNIPSRCSQCLLRRPYPPFLYARCNSCVFSAGDPTTTWCSPLAVK